MEPAVRRVPARLALAALALAAAACSRSSAPGPTGPTGASGAGGVAATAASGPGAAAAPGALAGGSWLTAAVSLRREPSEAPRVAGPGGKQVSNWVTTLQRGERIALVEARGEWAQVRTSGDELGWLKRSLLLEQEGTTLATLLVPADVFDRPDLLAANAKRKLDPGALLLVVRQRAPFAEVNAGPGPVVWVLADRLATDDGSVSTAKLLEKARWLKRSGKEDEARQILALGRSTFAGSPLLDVLATELGELPAGGAAGATGPPGTTGPAGAPGAAPLSPDGAPASPPGPAGPGTPR